MANSKIQVPAFIIHLDRATARKAQVESLQKSLCSLRIISTARAISAVDALQLTQEEIESVYHKKLFLPHYPFTLKKSEVACFLSHRRVWQQIVEQNLEAAFVAEDDMCPQKDFDKNLALGFKYLSQNGFIRFPHYNKEKGKILIKQGETQFILPNPLGLGMVAYLINRETAVKLLEFTKQFDRPIDVILQMFWLTNVYPAAIIPGRVAEISATLGGSTLAQPQNLKQKLRREFLRPLYRAKICLLSRIKG